jgi:hypothetical protein
MRILTWIGRLLAVLLVAAAGAWAIVALPQRPSAARSWDGDHARLARADFEGDSAVTLRGVRDFAYTSSTAYTPGFRDRRYDLSAIESVWFILTPFSTTWRGPAHAFVSFGFRDGEHIAVSVEARREVGEEYGLVPGVLRRFELAYIVGTERDLIGRRALFDGDDVFLYPIAAPPAPRAADVRGDDAPSQRGAGDARVLQHADQQLHVQPGRSRQPDGPGGAYPPAFARFSRATPTNWRSRSGSSRRRGRWRTCARASASTSGRVRSVPARTSRPPFAGGWSRRQRRLHLTETGMGRSPGGDPTRARSLVAGVSLGVIFGAIGIPLGILLGDQGLLAPRHGGGDGGCGRLHRHEVLVGLCRGERGRHRRLRAPQRIERPVRGHLFGA